MSKHLPPLEKLHFIERELSTLLKANRKSWVKIGKLLMTIEKESLYTLKHNSFTQYVHKLAAENKVNVSTFWRAKSAVHTYASLANVESHEQLAANTVKTTPEQLELYNKLKNVVPERILRDIRQQVVQGKNVRKELTDLWKIYKPLKKGKTERGRKPKKLMNLASATVDIPILSTLEEDALIDGGKQTLFNFSEAEIEKANMLNALRSTTWLRSLVEFPDFERRKDFFKLDIDTNMQYDFYGVMKPTQRTEEYILTIGAIILQLSSDVSKLARSVAFEQYANYLIFVTNQSFYSNHINELNEANENAGILVIQPEFTKENKLYFTLKRNSTYNTIIPQAKLRVYEALFEEIIDW